MFEWIVQLALSIVVMVLSGDLFYLYCAGAWGDNQIVVNIELLSLAVFFLGGFFNTARITILLALR